MKKMIASALCLLSFSAMASFNDVECEGTLKEKEIYFEIESSFPTGSVFRRANLIITENGSDSESFYTLTSRVSPGFNTITFNGAGLRLEIDTWPDSSPRWGRDYRATLTSSKLGSNQTAKLTCQFPNAF